MRRRGGRGYALSTLPAHTIFTPISGDAETQKNGSRTPPSKDKNRSPRRTKSRLNAKFGKSPQSAKFSRRKLRELSLIRASAARKYPSPPPSRKTNAVALHRKKNGAGTNSVRRKKVGYERDLGKNSRVQGKSGKKYSIGQIFLPKNAGSIAHSGEPCASAAQQLAHRRRTQPHSLGDFG